MSLINIFWGVRGESLIKKQIQTACLSIFDVHCAEELIIRSPESRKHYVILFQEPNVLSIFNIFITLHCGALNF